MLGLAFQLMGFINGYYTSVAVQTLVVSGAFAEAVSTFAVQMGIGAAVWAIVGRGNLGQSLGFLVAMAALL